MKYGILACIHANLPAIHAVLRDAEAQGCTHFACCGDIVGYGAQPKECLDLIRRLKMPCVKGNHDEYASCDAHPEGFNPTASCKVQWTRDQLTDDDRAWLQNLKLVEQVANFTITHGTLDAPERWEYVFEKCAAAGSFAHQKTSVCFFGHTHVPVAFVRDRVVRGGTYSKFKIEMGPQYFINVGSVGQPRNGNPKPAYAIYDLDQKTIEIRRVEFDGANGAPPPAGVPTPVR